MKKTLLLVLMLAGLATFTYGADRKISGTVYDESHQFLVGATIHVDGTSIATTADANGKYSINVPQGKSKLTFSFLGFISQTVIIKKANVIDVALKARWATLEEVVVVGYGTQKKSTVAGSISTVTSSDLKSVPSVQNQLSGKVAGVAVSNYKVRGNPSINETLKKTEGFEIDKNGYINYQGQQVSRVRINGKDYTGGDVSKAIQRLPSDIIEKIQVIDDYGNQAGKTGIKSGEAEKVLSLSLRDNNVLNDESYSQIIENQFINPVKEPLSTLATDVDAASYANVRRFINSGQLPPKNAVRIEEMINYFKYDMPDPKAGKPVAIHAEVTTAPWNPKHQLVRIGLKAKTVAYDKLPPSNLVFLIDVSGSMSDENKLPLVKTSLKMLVDQLRPVDHVAMVVYAGAAGMVLPSTSGDQKQKIKDAIDQLGAGGSTAGGAGLKLAYNIARQNFKKGRNNRIIMATDGDFNVGQSSDKDMEQLIEQERESGVSISILGYGMGNYKDSKMELLADKGHGNYAYIDNITEATRSMVTEFGGTLFTVAKDVKLQVEFNPVNVQAYRLLGYEDRLLAKEDFNNDAKLGGDMGVGHNVTALYEIIPVGVKDDPYTGSVDPLKYQNEQKAAASASSELMTVKFRYKDPEAEVSKMESIVVENSTIALASSSENMRFAAAVAEYGLLLRNSQFKQAASFEQLISLAKGAKGTDDQGYRAEFIRLAESTRDMVKSNALAAER